MPTGKPGTGPYGEARRRRERRSRKRGPYNLSESERERRRRQMVEQNAAGLMARKPVEDMDDDDVLAFVRRRVESYADEQGIDVDEALRRLTKEPADATTSAPHSAMDTRTDSHGFANAEDEADSTPSMASSSELEPDPCDDDPAFSAAYEQTRRELTGEVDDLEAQASRAFWSPREATVPSAHETHVIVEQIRRAYRD